MAAYQQVQNYLSNHYEGMDPEQLILMLYNGALSRLRFTRDGIKEKNFQKKGENLSKAIAIISELHASVDPEMDDASTRFLRGLYTAILTELPKVTMNDDLDTLDRAEGYISKLRDIWENDVMAKKKNGKSAQESINTSSGAPINFEKSRQMNTFHSFSV